MRTTTSLALLAGVLALGGCAQLVAFGQPIVGQPDEIPPDHAPAALVCDDEVDIGGSAFCTESCELDLASGETSCGERVTIEGERASLNVAGLREVELTATLCAGEGPAMRLTADEGGTVSVDGRALTIRAGERAYEEAEYLAEEGCAERTLTLQAARLAILESGRRVCAVDLLPFDHAWTLALSRERVHGVELCFRAPHSAD